MTKIYGGATLSNSACAVIWDMDGTLVDTAELHFQAWSRLAREIEEPFTRADFAATFGQRNPEIIRKFFRNHASDRELDSLGARKEDYYRAAARAGVTLLPGVRPLLEALHQAAFKQAIGSSAPRDNLHLILDLTQTESLFEALVSMEDTQRGKPDPQVFLVAASRLAVTPANCLVVEDAPAGVEAAKAGGMKCIAVTFVGHHAPELLTRAGADLVVNNLEQVSLQTVRQLLGHC
jgi:beta-phosphoglucomutase